MGRIPERDKDGNEGLDKEGEKEVNEGECVEKETRNRNMKKRKQEKN